MAVTEPEIAAGRRAFPEAQRLLAGTADRVLPGTIDVGWHGTETDPETGAFAVVSGDVEALEPLIGEVIRVTAGDRSILVYVLGARAVPQDISLTRRAFLALGLLSLESLAAQIEVMQ